MEMTEVHISVTSLRRASSSRPWRNWKVLQVTPNSEVRALLTALALAAVMVIIAEAGLRPRVEMGLEGTGAVWGDDLHLVFTKF